MSISQAEFIKAVMEPQAIIPEGLVDPAGAPTTKRFNVYRNNVAVSLTDALETSFPVVAKLIGADNFRKLAGVYLRAHPPSSPMMTLYGAEMPAFLDGFEPLQSIPYLSDVARLEQGLRQSYHAADCAAIDPEKLQSLSPDALMAATFQIAPAVIVIPSKWPLHAIWAYNTQDGTPKPEAVAQSVLITRPEFDPTPVAITKGAADLIEALRDGEPLGSALETASADPAFDFTTTLGHLLTGGAITRVNT